MFAHVRQPFSGWMFVRGQQIVNCFHIDGTSLRSVSEVLIGSIDLRGGLSLCHCTGTHRTYQDYHEEKKWCFPDDLQSVHVFWMIGL